MRSTNHSLGLGVVIGFSLAASGLMMALLWSSLEPSTPTQPPSPSPSPSPSHPTSELPTNAPATFTPIPPETLTPNVPEGLDLSATSTPSGLGEIIATGGLVYSGPLSPPKQVALYAASIKYARTTAEDSRQLSKQVNQVGYGDPTNICGPLAIAILQDAGIVPSYLSPHDYWLLDPSKPPDKRLLQNAFPDTLFTHEVIATGLNKVDWRAAPLDPGDFLFIWHGSGGNFDHMLVVNRVDAQGRAYAVTNFGTADGYVIAETMLYDPADPQAGIFRTWTQERDAILGSTGFGGYELWRMRKP